MKFIIFIMLGMICGFAEETAPAFKPGLKIIIKADDFGSAGGLTKDIVRPGFLKFAEIIKARKIKATIGVVAKGLDDKPKVQEWIKEQNATGLFEFWLHAWDHLPWKGPDGISYAEMSIPYDLQVEHLTAAQNMAIQKLGFPFKTYSPPGTGGEMVPKGAAVGHDLLKALHNDPYIKILMYPAPKDEDSTRVQSDGKITVLDRVWGVDIERPLFVPNFEEFKKGLQKARQYFPDREYLSIQGHPPKWDDQPGDTGKDFSEFEKILDYLIQGGATFITPSEYVEELKNSGRKPYGY